MLYGHARLKFAKKLHIRVPYSIHHNALKVGMHIEDIPLKSVPKCVKRKMHMNTICHLLIISSSLCDVSPPIAGKDRSLGSRLLGFAVRVGCEYLLRLLAVLIVLVFVVVLVMFLFFSLRGLLTGIHSS